MNKTGRWEDELISDILKLNVNDEYIKMDFVCNNTQALNKTLI